jgi:eukaryotic-like serine/threonine-protein kinase
LRILDFGVARVLEGTFLETRAGSVIGTLPYMAPEQMLGKSHEVDARSDVWSVGATAFTLVSGCFVHAADTPEEMMVYTGSRQAPSLASVAPRVPSVFVEVVDRALRFDKSQRWPSARAMQSAFAEAYSSLRRREQDASPPSPADTAVGSHGSASATLVSSRETARRPRAGVPHWARTALAAVAVTGGIAALGVHGPRGRQAAPPSLAVPARASLLSFASQGARIAAAVADTIGAPAAADTIGAPAAATPDAPTASAETPQANGPSARAAEAVPSVRRASFARPLPPAQQLRAALGSNLRRRPSVDSSPSGDACTPPFVIQASTGKKKWKRECL